MPKNISIPIEREWMSPDEAEAFSGRSVWTWRKDAYLGKIGSSKVGRRLFLRAADVRRVMEEGFRPALSNDAA